MLEGLYQRLSYPLGVEKPSSELKEAIKILDWDIKAWQVISASTLTMILTFALVTPFFILLLLSKNFLTAALLLTVPIGVYIFLTEYPKYLAKAEISKEVGEIPIFISELIILLKQNPNIEKAIEFLSELDGRIFKKIKAKFNELKIEGKGNGKELLLNFAEEYSNVFPEFKRSLILILNGEYERGMELCLNGISNKIEEFSNKLTIPTMILFSVGAIFPLIFVSLLPAFSLLETNTISLLLVIIATSLFVFIYSNSILSRRPLVFPTVTIRRNRRDNILWYILISTIISFPAIIYSLTPVGVSPLLPKGYNLIWGVIGVTVGITLFAYKNSKEALEYRKYIEKMERDAPSISYNLAALAYEGKPLDEELMKIDFESSQRMKLLKHLIEKSLSKGTRKLYELLSSFGDYFSKVDSIRDSFFNKIDNTIEMMKITAIILLPIVAAISVSITHEININSENIPFFELSQDIETTIFISGTYTLLTSLLILRYIVYLRNGNDKIAYYESLYKYLPLAIGIFVMSYSLIPEVI